MTLRKTIVILFREKKKVKIFRLRLFRDKLPQLQNALYRQLVLLTDQHTCDATVGSLESVHEQPFHAV